MDVVALKETRRPLAGKIPKTTRDYVIYYSGSDEGRYQRGVGFTVSKRMAHAGISFEALGK